MVSGATSIRIMLVEDNLGFRRLLERLLTRQPDLEVVAQAGSLTDARNIVGTVGLDVAVLDLGLPDGSGADLISDLRRGDSGVAVLIFSASLDPASLDMHSYNGPRVRFSVTVGEEPEVEVALL